MREALAIDKKNLGDGHPSVAVGLNNLANLLEAKVSLSVQLEIRSFAMSRAI